MSDGTDASSSSPTSKTYEALVAEVEQHRATQSEDAYVGFCALLCRTGRLRPGQLRAMVWRDVALGCEKVDPVPMLGDGIIRQYQEETRSQATGSAATHSRENTNMEESFDSTVSRPTPRMADNSNTAEKEKGADVLDDAETPPQLSARSTGGESTWTNTSSNAGTSVLGSPGSLTRRSRHRSVEPLRPSREDPLNGKTHTRGRTSPLVVVPPRRRAVSQLSRRVKAECTRYSDLIASDPDAGNASSSNELTGSILRPMAWYHLPENCQPRVVEADIERSLWKLYTKSEERIQHRRILENMILRILLHNPDRFYYQGLHELMGFVMYTLLPSLGKEEVVSVCNGLLTTRWRQFSARRLTNSEAMLYAVHAIIAQEDPPLAAALEWCGVGPESHYAVSWVITWYVHSVENVEVLTRLFDYFIADATGTAVLYFTAAFVISQRSTIFEWIHAAKEEMGVDTDAPEATEDGIVLMARVYAQLSRLPGSVLQSMNAAAVETLITKAENFATLYHQVVAEEEANFLRGDVKKLGMLSNTATRNAALRLLWHFLPREWRNPAKAERVRRFVFWTSIMVAATAVVVGTAAVDAKQTGWMRHLFH